MSEAGHPANEPAPARAGISTTTGVPAGERRRALVGQTVVVIGGSAGIGLETARLARGEGAAVIMTARNPERLQQAARERELDAQRSAAFDATDFTRLGRFFEELPKPIDHVLVTASRPYYARLADMDLEQVRRDVDGHFWLTLQVARNAIGKVRPGGTLLFMSGTGPRRPAVGQSTVSAFAAALPALTQNLALELAPIRVNLIAPGFVDTPLSAALLGDQLDKRREQLRATLPIRRVVGPADVAALAVHVMTNTALTGATFDIDGGQQLL
jgi:NAD(P)-dependent dehydrogenase (short-subunit alcohol dehydrogenase family)